MNAKQCRAARALLGWTIRDLSKNSGISVNSISDFENGKSKMLILHLAAVKNTFEANGVEFVGEVGVKLNS